MSLHNHVRKVIARKVPAALLTAGLLAVLGTSYAQKNPVDPVSNPQGLEFSDVEMDIPDYAPPFQRKGAPVANAALFRQIMPGMSAAQVQSVLGEPLNRTSGESGTEWNYNFTLTMPVSKTHMVCQYKVVYDDRERVKDAVWRRNQCLDIVNQAAGS